MATTTIGSSVPTTSRKIFRLVRFCFDTALPASFFAAVVWAKAGDFAGRFRQALPWTGENLSVTLPAVAELASQASAITFLTLVIVLYFFRRPAIVRATDFRLVAFALGGSFAPTVIAMSPRTFASPAVHVGAALLAVGGTAFAIWGLVHLKRCFSIFPEVRGLVTTGPYRLVRHPLYVGEWVACLGLLLPAISPLTIAIFCIETALQYRRMLAEEAALARVFPDYLAYASRVRRF